MLTAFVDELNDVKPSSELRDEFADYIDGYRALISSARRHAKDPIPDIAPTPNDPFGGDPDTRSADATKEIESAALAISSRADADLEPVLEYCESAD